MSWRWLILDFADPNLPLTFRQRLKINMRLIWIGRLPRKVRNGRSVFALMMFVGYALILPATCRWFAQQVGTSGISLGLLAAFLFAFCWVWCIVSLGLSCRREFRYRTRLQGFEVCIGCGYWFRGLEDAVRQCPGCGAARETMPVDRVDQYVCTSCRYDLRGLSADSRCPECGAEQQVEVQR